MAAYRFLRTVENCIQLEADQQRYLIPEKETEERELARRVGYPHTTETDALAAFREDYRVHTETGARHFLRRSLRLQFNLKMGLTSPFLLSEEDPHQLEKFLEHVPL